MNSRHLLLILSAAAFAGCVNPGRTRLTRAIYANRVEKARTLIAAGDGIDAAEGDSPLVAAIHMNQKGLTSSLLDKGVDVNRSGYYNNFPIIAASRMGWADIVQRLLEKGVNVSVEDYLGWTALMWAKLLDKSDVVALLQEHGAGIRPDQNEFIAYLKQHCSYEDGIELGTAFFNKAYNSELSPEGQKKIENVMAGCMAYDPTKGRYHAGVTKGSNSAFFKHLGEDFISTLPTLLAIGGALTIAQASFGSGSAGGGGPGAAASGGARCNPTGCPSWAPWRESGYCYRTSQEACRGKTMCHAFNCP